MAYLLNPSNSGHFVGDNSVVTTLPMTLSLWKKTNSPYSTAMLLEISDGTYFNRCTLVQEVSGGNQAILAFTRTTTTGVQSFASVSAIQSYDWQHVCVVFASATSRTAYINGVGGAVDTVSVTPINISKIFIGARSDQAFTFNGTVAEAAVYNAALTQEEITMLSKGISPELVRPGNLKIYCPLIRNTNAIFGGFNLSAPYSVFPAAHPRMF